MSGPDQTRVQVDDLARALLRLHKALLDSERVSYERVHGRIPSNGEFFRLVLGHAWFAWLRPLSYQMARLDELCEQGEPSCHAEIAEHLASVRTLLTPSEAGEGFGRHYYDALQREPAVVLAHAEVRSRLRSLGSG